MTAPDKACGRRWLWTTLLACLFGSMVAADTVGFTGLITQSTQDGTGPAVNNPGELLRRFEQESQALGHLKLDQRKFADVESLLRQAVSAYQKSSADTWRLYYTESMLGESLSGLGKYAEAEPLLVSGYQGMIQRQNSIPFENRPELDEARGWITQLYQAWGKPEQAVAWRHAEAVIGALRSLVFWRATV